MDVLQTVGRAITHLPETFHPHRQIKKVYEQRRQMIETGARGAEGGEGALVFGRAGPLPGAGSWGGVVLGRLASAVAVCSLASARRPRQL